MNKNVEALIAQTESIARSGDEAEALRRATELVRTYPGNFRVWSLRAYLFGREKQYSKAIADLTRAIELNGLEPDFFFNRGSYFFHLEEHDNAVRDFTKGLELCDYHGNDYYRDTLHFGARKRC
jgi:Flp pilus assembly protein TadD